MNSRSVLCALGIVCLASGIASAQVVLTEDQMGLFAEFLAQRAGTDSWWLSSAADFKSLPLDQASERIAFQESLIVAQLASSAGTTFTQELVRFIEPIIVTVHDNGSSFSVRRSAPEYEGSHFEICFVPFDQAPNMPLLPFYDEEWQALILPAIDWPPALLAALSFPELSYWYSGGTDPEPADELITQEIVYQTLNYTTAGAMERQIDTFITRHRESGCDQMRQAITATDLMSFATSLGAEQGGLITAYAVLVLFQDCLEYRLAVTANCWFW